MSNQQSDKAQPSFRIFSVLKNGEKSIWQEIGAAWPHKDGKGLNLSYTARPLEGAQVVLRVPMDKLLVAEERPAAE